MARTINKIGVFLFECVTKEKIELETKQRAESMIPKALAMAVQILDQGSFLIAIEVSEVLAIYLSILKKIGVNETTMSTLQTIFQIIVKRIGYPEWYSFEQDIEPNSSEEHFTKFRGTLTVLFTNLAEIKQVQGDVIRYVSELLAKAKDSAGLSVRAREAPLYLFYILGAAVADSETRLENWGKLLADPQWAVLDQGMALVLSTGEIFSTVPLVLLGFEILVRYAGYFQVHSELLESCFKLFSSELYTRFLHGRGIYSANRRIASKAAHEFFKFIDALKKHKDIFGYYPSILLQTKNCISECLQGRRNLTQESIDDLYQLIGIVLAHPSTTASAALTTLKVFL